MSWSDLDCNFCMFFLRRGLDDSLASDRTSERPVADSARSTEAVQRPVADSMPSFSGGVFTNHTPCEAFLGRLPLAED